MKFKIKNAEVQGDVSDALPEFPKYTTQIMNLANQNAQGTRPSVVGQMSELIQQFPGRTYAEWVVWYSERMPDAVDAASQRVVQMIENLKQAIMLIDVRMVRAWVTDLVLTKTFTGLKFQESILKRLAQRLSEPYRLAKPEEEATGIDGFVGGTPVSIKPSTYRSKKSLSEHIDAPIIFCEKRKDGITVEVDWV